MSKVAMSMYVAHHYLKLAKLHFESCWLSSGGMNFWSRARERSLGHRVMRYTSATEMVGYEILHVRNRG